MKTGDQELERLRDALEQAKELYEGAKVEYKLAVHRMHDLGATHPDGSIRHATRVYNYALRAYALALKRFNRFIIDGKLPDEEDPENPAIQI